ncbi:MAG: penicillin-binding protein 2 [Flavobacteriales bacterium]|mgnify:CR=1 FL=1|jgi:penicillin-binding protein 2|tara:strand:- start:11900 stop:13732 length:1833 start_codon:yes stop_codon:yes gene_type:complete
MSRNKFADRRLFFYFLFGGSAVLLLITLFGIQVINNSYKISAENNVIKAVTIYPERGYIYDREGVLLVTNQRAYDLMVTPRQVRLLDTLALCEIINIDLEYFNKNIKIAKRYSTRKASLFLKEISKQTAAQLQERLYEFPGFYLQERTMRQYPESSAAHILGYVSQVPDYILKKDDYYKRNDNYGISGVESSYEKDLRGVQGTQYLIRDVWNRPKGSFANGEYDSLAVNGKDIELSIDIQLQEYAEQLMLNKKGSIVAIEPSTGEILSLVSSPYYDPNLLVGRSRSPNFNRMYKDANKALFDRSLLAEYPPGSTFKLVNALIGLQEGVIYDGTRFTCDEGWRFSAKLKIGCHAHRSPLNLIESIEQSCNAYYCNTFRRIIEKYPTAAAGYENWRNHVLSFGLGKFLDNDLYTGRPGRVPTVDFYNKQYGEKRWKAPTVISLAIGQDALVVSPIQMANMCAVIANRGHYYTPHIVRKVDGAPLNDSTYSVPKYTSIDKKHYSTIINGMERVFIGKHGTAKTARLKDIEICGKTGTAENPHGDDHSIFIAFAPKDNPKIALAVYVENGGWGSTWAAPIASLMIEKYLTGKISNTKQEAFILNGNLMNTEDAK